MLVRCFLRGSSGDPSHVFCAVTAQKRVLIYWIVLH
jgi:hypothetical protein